MLNRNEKAKEDEIRTFFRGVIYDYLILFLNI